LNKEDKIMIGKELVPNAIEEFLAEFKSNPEIYWNKNEYIDFSNEKDLELFGEIYLKLRGRGKDLIEIGKHIYEKGEKNRLPGFDVTYSNENN
jgi:hypothetical protein